MADSPCVSCRLPTLRLRTETTRGSPLISSSTEHMPLGKVAVVPAGAEGKCDGEAAGEISARWPSVARRQAQSGRRAAGDQQQLCPHRAS